MRGSSRARAQAERQRSPLHSSTQEAAGLAGGGSIKKRFRSAAFKGESGGESEIGLSGGELLTKNAVFLRA